MKQKSERILSALGDIDDRYVLECLPLLFAKPRHRRRSWLLAAACLALCVLAASKAYPYLAAQLAQQEDIAQPVEPVGPGLTDTDQPDSDDSADVLYLPMLTMGTVDLSGETPSLLLSGADTLLTGNPMDLEALPETLPVYRTADTAADWDAMEETLWAAADFLGVTGETARNDEGIELQNYEEAHIFVDRNQSVEIDLYAEELRNLPEGCGSDSLETAQAAADYFLETYGEQFDMTEPKAVVTGGYWRLTPSSQRYNVVTYDVAGDAVDQLVQFSLSQTVFCLDPEGVYYIEINRHTLGEKCGDYPILTPQEAEALLQQGYGVTAVPETAREETPEIASAELIYLAPEEAGFYIPYYRFLVPLPENEESGALKEYGIYYIPAVRPEYISDNQFWKTEEIEIGLVYQQDTDIPQGDPVNIVQERSVLDQEAYSGILENGGWVLGLDSQERILILDGVTYDVKAFSHDGSSVVLRANLMEDRGNAPLCAGWDGGNYVAWSECPYASGLYDETNGASWRVYLADLSTGAITLIDQDTGLRPNMENPYHYLAPTDVCIADGFVSYISFTERGDGEVVQSVMLYSIAEDTLTTVYCLDADPAENALGWTSIGGGKLAWSQAYLRPDSLYEGFTSVYDLSTKQISILRTEDNIINPCMAGAYLIAENNPNQTYYDSEIVVYSLASHLGLYKISPSYPDYALRSSKGVNLGGISAWGRYVTWTGNILTNVLLFDLESGQLYSIVSGRYDVSGVRIYPGGLLLWQERALSETGELTGYTSFCILSG